MDVRDKLRMSKLKIDHIDVYVLVCKGAALIRNKRGISSPKGEQQSKPKLSFRPTFQSFLINVANENMQIIKCSEIKI